VNPVPAAHQRHEDTVDLLVERLIHKLHDGNAIVRQNVRYSHNHLNGEIDVLVETKDRWRFYEVKATDLKNNWAKAKEQYKRYCKAYPDREIVGIYVTPTRIRRMQRYHPPSPEELSSRMRKKYARRRMAYASQYASA